MSSLVLVVLPVTTPEEEYIVILPSVSVISTLPSALIVACEPDGKLVLGISTFLVAENSIVAFVEVYEIFGYVVVEVL